MAEIFKEFFGIISQHSLAESDESDHRSTDVVSAVIRPPVSPLYFNPLKYVSKKVLNDREEEHHQQRLATDPNGAQHREHYINISKNLVGVHPLLHQNRIGRRRAGSLSSMSDSKRTTAVTESGRRASLGQGKTRIFPPVAEDVIHLAIPFNMDKEYSEALQTGSNKRIKKETRSENREKKHKAPSLGKRLSIKEHIDRDVYEVQTAQSTDWHTANPTKKTSQNKEPEAETKTSQLLVVLKETEKTVSLDLPVNQNAFQALQTLEEEKEQDANKALEHEPDLIKELNIVESGETKHQAGKNQKGGLKKSLSGTDGSIFPVHPIASNEPAVQGKSQSVRKSVFKELSKKHNDGQRIPSCDLTHFDSHLFDEVESTKSTAIVVPESFKLPLKKRLRVKRLLTDRNRPLKQKFLAKSKAEHSQHDTGQKIPACDAAFFDPHMFDTPPLPATSPHLRIKLSPLIGRSLVRRKRKRDDGQKTPACDDTYFDASLFNEVEKQELFSSSSRRKSWIRRTFNKVFKPEKKEKIDSDKDSKGKTSFIETPTIETSTLSTLPKASFVNWPACDETFFDPSLFATPTPNESRADVKVSQARRRYHRRRLHRVHGADTAPYYRHAPATTTGQTHDDNLRMIAIMPKERPELQDEAAVEAALSSSGASSASYALDNDFWEELEESIGVMSLANDGSFVLNQSLKNAVLNHLFSYGKPIPQIHALAVYVILTGPPVGDHQTYRSLIEACSSLAPITATAGREAIIERMTRALCAYHEKLSGITLDYSPRPLVTRLVDRLLALPWTPLPLDSLLLHQEQQVFYVLLGLMYDPRWQWVRAFTRHGLKELSYELRIIAEHEGVSEKLNDPSLRPFAINELPSQKDYQSCFDLEKTDSRMTELDKMLIMTELSDRLLDLTLVDGRAVLHRIAISLLSCPEEPTRWPLILADLHHITNEQLDNLHEFYEGHIEQHQQVLHHLHQAEHEADLAVNLLSRLKLLIMDLEPLLKEKIPEMRLKISSERTRVQQLEHGQQNLICQVHRLMQVFVQGAENAAEMQQDRERRAIVQETETKVQHLEGDNENEASQSSPIDPDQKRRRSKTQQP